MGGAGAWPARCHLRAGYDAGRVGPPQSCSRGQKVESVGHTWYDADERATELAKECGFTHISTNEHPVLWHGISTIVEELADQGEKPDAIVCSVGSGGLISGLCEGFDSQTGWEDIPIVGWRHVRRRRVQPIYRRGTRRLPRNHYQHHSLHQRASRHRPCHGFFRPRFIKILSYNGI